MTIVAMPAQSRAKTPAEIEPGDWFLTQFRGCLVCWVCRSAPANAGGAIGWTVKAVPLEQQDGSPWPEGLSRETQPVRLSDIREVLAPAVPGGVN